MDSLEQLNKFLSKDGRPRFKEHVGPNIRPRVLCGDGFEMSIQASSTHYCRPREDTGPWTHVEVGFPNRIEPLLWQYAEERGRWTDAVYPFVPIELAAAVVELHGGLVDCQEKV